MGTFNEFLEKLQNDPEFAVKVSDAVKARQDAGDAETGGILRSAAEECGYSVTEEEMKAYIMQQQSKAEELSEEEMGKVSGGTLFILATVLITKDIVQSYDGDDHHENRHTKM